MMAALDSRQPLRDQAILAFFIGTGCRLGEVAGLRVDDLQLLADGAGTAHVVGKRTKSNQTGERDVAFDAATGRYLIRYMDALWVHDGPLWIGEDDDKIAAAGLYQMVKRTVKRAGLEDHIKGCHDLRRAFATILGMMHQDSPAWSDMIRRQLGHKHYAMTAHYTLIEVDDIRDRIVTPLLLEQGQVPPGREAKN
jgi:integrase